MDQPISEVAAQAPVSRLRRRDALPRRCLVHALALPSSDFQGAAPHFRPSVNHSNGESDIVVDWERSDGKRLQVLIEVKLSAQFMPRQGARYRERALQEMRQDSGLDVRTGLLAPGEWQGSCGMLRYVAFALPIGGRACAGFRRSEVMGD